MAKENRIVSYPRMWLVIKLRLEAKKRGCSISEIISEALYQYLKSK